MRSKIQNIFCAAVAWVLISSVAWSQNDVRFTPPSEVQQSDQYKGYVRAAKATKMMVSQAGSGSGVFVSHTGNYLTVMHGFYGCLIEKGVAQKREVPGSKLIYYVNDLQKLKDLTCPIFVNNTKVDAPVLAVGPGFYWSDRIEIAKLSLEFYDKLISDGISNAGDFIVLKLPFKNDESPCVAADAAEPKPRSAVWSFGFPGATYRQNGHDSNGKDQYFTSGRVTIPPKENVCFDSEFGGKSPQQIELITYFYVDPGTVWTTLDANLGSSGSPAFNADGKLTGMVTVIMNAGKEARVAFCPATSITTVQTIGTLLQMEHSSISFDQIFNCIQ